MEDTPVAWLSSRAQNSGHHFSRSMSANASNVISLKDRRRAASTIDAQCLGGTLLRSNHFRARPYGEPTSAQKTLNEGQRDMMSRTSMAQTVLVQPVHRVKHKLYDDSVNASYTMCPMAGGTEDTYWMGFQARLRAARKRANKNQREIAAVLQITQNQYRHYETRDKSLMPHNLILPFCLATNISVEWLLDATTSVDAKPRQRPMRADPKLKRRPKRTTA